MFRCPRWFGVFLLFALLLPAGFFAQASAAPGQKSATATIWRERATGAGAYIVVLKSSAGGSGGSGGSGGVSASSVSASVADKPGVDITHTYTSALNGFSAQLSGSAVSQLKSDPRVDMIVADGPVHAFAQEIPAGAKRVGAANNATAKIDGVDQRVNADIAILDMGVGPSTDLNIAGGYNCVRSTGATNQYGDLGGHGTHVAGIAAAIDNGSGTVGVAPGARIWSVRVLPGSGDGTWSDVLCGINWVTQNATKIDVANMSLGDSSVSDNPDLDNTIHNAIKASVAAGVTYTVAAGNDGQNASTTVPAKYSEVIAVSAFCDSDGKPGGLGPSLSACADDRFAYFSNYGSVVDISAPGVDTRSLALGGGINVMSGTSFASPHVAGGAALYIAQFGRVGPAAVRSALLAASEKGTIPGDPDGYHEPRLSVGSFVAPTVVMGHPSGPVGDKVTVELSKFPINATATILFDSKVVGTTTTDATGAVWYKITVPEGVRGTHIITVTASNSKGTSKFFVNSKLTSISPSPNHFGQSVTFKGNGYNASESVTLAMTGPTSTTLATGKANSLGTVSITVTSPAAIAGNYTATLKSSKGSSGSRAFTIAPSMTLSAASIPPGGSVKTTIRGFQAGETFVVSYRNSLGTYRMCSSKATTATGSSSCTGKIPASSTKGKRTIEARGSKGTFVSMSITVVVPSASSIASPTKTPTKTATPAKTVTPAASATVTATPTPGLNPETATPTPTQPATETATPAPTATEIPTMAPTETATATPSPTEIPTLEPTATDAPADGSPPAG